MSIRFWIVLSLRSSRHFFLLPCGDNVVLVSTICFEIRVHPRLLKCFRFCFKFIGYYV